MKYFLLLFTLLITHLVTAQELPTLPIRPNAYGTDSLKTGEWVYYYNIQREEITPETDSVAFYSLIDYQQGKPIGKMGEYNRSEQILMSATLISEDPKRYDGSVFYYSEEGNIISYAFFNEGNFSLQKSIDGFKPIVEELRDRLPNHVDYTSALINLALIYGDLGRYNEAESLYIEGLNIIKKELRQNHHDYVAYLNNLSLLYAKLGRYAEAESFLLETLDVMKSQGNENRMAGFLINLSIIYADMGRYIEAESSLLRASKIFKAKNGKNSYSYFLCLANLAIVYHDMDRLAKAESLSLEALEIIKTIHGEKDSDYAIVLGNLAELYVAMDRYVEAELLHLKALGILKIQLGENHPDYATPLYNLASLYQMSGKEFELSEEYYHKALAIDEKHFGENSQNVIGGKSALATFYYQQKRTNEAVPLFIECLDYYEKHLQEYFEYLGENERVAFYSTLKGNFEQFTQFAIQESANYSELLIRAYHLQLRHKAILLNTSNQIKRRIMNSGDRKLIALFDEVQTLRQQLGQAQGLNKDEQQQLGLNADSLKQELFEKDKQLTGLSTFYNAQNKVPTWQDVQASLGKKEAAVEIVRYREYDYKKQEFTDTVKYTAFVITSKNKNGLKAIQFPDGNFLEEKAVKAYTNAIRFQLDDEQSYRYFWQPLQDALKNIEKIYFSPDGVFHQVNMATLYDPEKEQYLSEELEIQLLTSSRDLLESDQERLPNQYGLLLGNPNFGTVPDSIKNNNQERNTEIDQLLSIWLCLEDSKNE